MLDDGLEIQRMIAHGLSVAEALVAATAGGAYALGLESQVGTVTVGKLADLIVVDGDPFLDSTLLAHRQRMWLVLQLGVPVAGSALERNLV